MKKIDLILKKTVLFEKLATYLDINDFLKIAQERQDLSYEEMQKLQLESRKHDLSKYVSPEEYKKRLKFIINYSKSLLDKIPLNKRNKQDDDYLLLVNTLKYIQSDDIDDLSKVVLLMEKYLPENYFRDLDNKFRSLKFLVVKENVLGPPSGYVYAKIDPDDKEEINQLIKTMLSSPVGTSEEIEIDSGKKYLAKVEQYPNKPKSVYLYETKNQQMFWEPRVIEEP